MDPLVQEIESLEPVKLSVPSTVSLRDLCMVSTILRAFPGESPVLIRIQDAPYDGTGEHRDILLNEDYNVDAFDQRFVDTVATALADMFRRATEA